MRLLTDLVVVAGLVGGGIGVYQLLEPTYRLPLVVGAVPYWDLGASIQAVTDHRQVIDEATPWWYGITTNGGVSSELPGGDRTEHDLLTRLTATGAKVIPSVADTTDGAWAPTVLQGILHDPARRRAHIEALLILAVARGFPGLQIDYEDLTAADRDVFTQFIRELATAMHTHGKVLYVTVHPKATDAGYDQRNLAQDYTAIGASADKVVVMAYDWHWASSPAGPIAPLWWVSDVLRYASTRIAPDKLVLGLGLYGYDWVGQQGQPLVWQQVDALAPLPGTISGWDDASASPYLIYDQGGVHHEVWYENAASLTAKLDLAAQFRVGGVELWRLGAEDPGLWGPLADRHRTVS